MLWCGPRYRIESRQVIPSRLFVLAAIAGNALHDDIEDCLAVVRTILRCYVCACVIRAIDDASANSAQVVPRQKPPPHIVYPRTMFGFGRKVVAFAGIYPEVVELGNVMQPVIELPVLVAQHGFGLVTFETVLRIYGTVALGRPRTMYPRPQTDAVIRCEQGNAGQIG